MFVESTLSPERDKDLIRLSFFSLNSRFVRLFLLSLKLDPGIETVTLGPICISLVYYIYLERYKDLLLLSIFDPLSLLCVFF